MFLFGHENSVLKTDFSALAFAIHHFKGDIFSKLYNLQ
jgi:hypothetical protein